MFGEEENIMVNLLLSGEGDGSGSSDSGELSEAGESDQVKKDKI